MKLEAAIQKVRDVIRLRHLSLSTEDNYCAWASRYGPRKIALAQGAGMR